MVEDVRLWNGSRCCLRRLKIPQNIIWILHKLCQEFGLLNNISTHTASRFTSDSRIQGDLKWQHQEIDWGQFLALIHPSDQFLRENLPWRRCWRLPWILASRVNMLAVPFCSHHNPSFCGVGAVRIVVATEWVRNLSKRPDVLHKVYTDSKEDSANFLAFLNNVLTHSVAAHSSPLHPLANYPKLLFDPFKDSWAH